MSRGEPELIDIRSRFENLTGLVDHEMTVYFVSNKKEWKSFSKYKNKITDKRPHLELNGLVTRELYLGTRTACLPGSGTHALCEKPECLTCRTLQDGVVLADDAAIIVHSNPLQAMKDSTSHRSVLGQTGRCAVLACQVVTGHIRVVSSIADLENENLFEGYNSMLLKNGDASRRDYCVALRTPHAAVVTQLLVVGSVDKLCAKCGIRLKEDEAADDACASCLAQGVAGLTHGMFVMAREGSTSPWIPSTTIVDLDGAWVVETEGDKALVTVSELVPLVPRDDSAELPTFRRGDRVFARWYGEGAFLEATVLRDNQDGTLSLSYQETGARDDLTPVSEVLLRAS